MYVDDWEREILIKHADILDWAWQYLKARESEYMGMFTIKHKQESVSEDKKVCKVGVKL